MYCYHCMSRLEGSPDICPVCGKAVAAAPANNHLRPGCELSGRYIVGAAIGEGGFGITYIGLDTKLGMKVAVKEYFPLGIASRAADNAVSVTQPDKNGALYTDGKEKFLSEARVMARFSGAEGVVDVRDFFEENGTAYIVMEYLDGKTLLETIREKGAMTYEKTVELLTPVMKALTRIHSQGVLHRDVGPDNIMLTKDKVKLLDFGSARGITADSKTVVIKPGFAPEEQYHSDAPQSEALDVYSLSATIYYCLTGVVPPAGISRVGLDTLKTPSELGVKLSPAREEVILKGMSVKAQDRYSSVSELMNALEAAPAQSDPADDFKTVYADDTSVKADNTAFAVDKKSAERRGREDFRAERKDDRVIRDFDADDKKKKERPKKDRSKDKKDDFVPADRYSQPEKKKKKPLKIILIVVAIILAVAIIGILVIVKLIPGMQKKEIGGKETRTDTSIYTFSNTTVTRDMLLEVDQKLKKLDNLSFSQAAIEEDAIPVLTSMDQITTLHFYYCPYPSFAFISEMPQLESLTVSGCNLSNDVLKSIDFSKLTSLKFVYLDKNPELSDLSPLSSASATLMHIKADVTAVSDLSLLGKCEAVTELSFNQCQIEDLSCLSANFPHVDELYLYGNKISDLTGMEGLAELRSFILSNNQISDIEPLAACTDLYNVDLSKNQIKDLSPLGNSKWLKYLDLEENEIEGVEELSTLRELEKLNLKNNKIGDLTGMEYNIKLKMLNLSGNQITDISPLKNTTVLVELSMNDNEISDISPLGNTAAALKYLYFNNNKVTDISVLADAAALEYLSFDFNGVSDIKALADKPELAGVSAEHNQISSVEALTSSPKLNYMYLSFNKIKDITPLSGAKTSGSALNFDSGDRPRLYINLSNNEIERLVFAEKANYAYLAIHGNPLNSIENLPEEATYLSISYYDGLKPDILEGSKFNKFQIVDCPLDKQVAFEESLNKSFQSHVSFASEEEANAAIAAEKHKLLYGDSIASNGTPEGVTEATEVSALPTDSDASGETPDNDTTP